MEPAYVMPRWSTPLYLVADLIMPRGCAGCDRTLSEDQDRFCPTCTARLMADLAVDYCPRCGGTAEPYLTTAEGCPQCRHRRGPLDGIARVGTYACVVGDMVKRFKFGGQQRLDHALGSLLADAMRRHAWCDGLDALVPVPADWREWFRYRFHPAGLIAGCVGGSLGLESLPLVRARGKRRRQTGLPETERALNIRGVFRLACGARVQGASLCVIDDVSTSGATLRELARVLKAAGAAHVFGAVVAKTVLGDDDGLPAAVELPGSSLPPELPSP